MKAVLTILLVLVFGAVALAQNVESHDKIKPIKMGIVLDAGIHSTVSKKEMDAPKEKSVARLYRFKNSRVKKALRFTTKRNKSKLV